MGTVMLNVVNLCRKRLGSQRDTERLLDGIYLATVAQPIAKLMPQPTDITTLVKPLPDVKQLVKQVGAGIARHRNMVNVRRGNPPNPQAFPHGQRRKSRTVLDPIEPFLLNRADQLAVNQQRRAGIAMERIQTQNSHINPATV